MTTSGAYRILGLTPWAQYAKVSPYIDRQLGSTTLMAVEAALLLAKGEDVCLVCRTRTQAKTVALNSAEYAMTLAPQKALGRAVMEWRQGPYSEIRVLEWWPEFFKAFGADDKFILALTHEGGEELLGIDPDLTTRKRS